MNQLCLVQSIDRLRQRIVITISQAAHLGFNPRLGVSFGVLNGHVLRAMVAMINQAIPFRVSGIQRLLQRIEDEVRAHGTADVPELPGKIYLMSSWPHSLKS